MKYRMTPALWRDFEALCGFGGRLCGTPSEARARAYLAEPLQELAGEFGGEFSRQALPYDGWRGGAVSLEVPDGTSVGTDAVPLVWSPPSSGLDLPVFDLGRGPPEEIATRPGGVEAGLVLARHEYMFSTRTIHRSRKYAAAVEAGAAAFAMVGSEAGQPVTGGAGFGGLAAIPAIGLAPDTADRLTRAGRVRLSVNASTAPAETENLILDLPGRTHERVVLSAHIDGHDLAQSAMDNATGLAAALETARLLAPRVAGFRRGLRVCLFSLEEWGLVGSHRYVEGLSEADRTAIALTVNLDSIAGSSNLAAMSSGFPAVETFLADVGADLGVGLTFHRPLLRNSDHYNFAVAGIPAFRLVAGFEDPSSNLRHVLTPGDTIDKVEPADLDRATMLVAAATERACSTDVDFRVGAGR